MTPLSGGMDIFLQPGEWYVGDAGTSLRTILGSCVAITLWHPKRRIGAMCHFMLHRRGRAGGEPDGRYADEAMWLMQRELAALGVRPHYCEAKLFGGGAMLGDSDLGLVPATNIAAARQLVEHYRLQVKSEHLGGRQHRQLIFDIKTGDVWMRLGRAADAPEKKAV